MGIYMNIFKIQVLFTVLVLAECRSNYGTEFSFGFPYNQYEHNLCNQLTVDIASEFEGNATLIFPYKTETFFIFKQNITSISVNCSLVLFGNYTQFNGVYLTTTVNVSVFATDYSRYSSSTFLILPYAVLGRSYVSASYFPVKNQSYILIVGTKNNTNVVISDSRSSIINNYTINKLEIAQLTSSEDLTAFTVESNKPVAVITGATCSNVPVGVGGCDSLMQEMIPNDVTDNIFVVPPIPNTIAYELRVVKTSNASHSRVCVYNKTQNFCVNDSVSLSFLMNTDPTVVIADRPHSVIQYGVGRTYGGHDRGFGDPFMTILPGIHNYLNKYVFLIPDTYKRCSNFISVMIPYVNVDGLVLDGSRPNISKIYNVTAPLANYSVLTIDTVTGYHVIYHNIKEVTFGVLVYGYGLSDPIGYGYPAGILMENRAGEYKPTELMPATSVSPTRVSAGTIVGIIVGVIALAIIFILIAFLVKRKRKIKPNFTEDKVDEAENTSSQGVTENTGQSDQ